MAAKKAARDGAKAPRATTAAPAVREPVNRFRGQSAEAAIKLGDKKYPLVLTLNAIVEIEDGLGMQLAEMGQALSKPTMRQIRTLIGALVRGGGADLTDEEVGREPFDPNSAGSAIVAAFVAAGLLQPEGEATPGPQV